MVEVDTAVDLNRWNSGRDRGFGGDRDDEKRGSYGNQDHWKLALVLKEVMRVCNYD